MKIHLIVRLLKTNPIKLKQSQFQRQKNAAAFDETADESKLAGVYRFELRLFKRAFGCYQFLDVGQLDLFHALSLFHKVVVFPQFPFRSGYRG